jgi:membrane-associated phospholipid phosphatase
MSRLILNLWTARPLVAAGIALLVGSLIAFVDRPVAKLVATSKSETSQDLAQVVSLFGEPMLYLLVGAIAIVVWPRTGVIRRNRVLFMVLAATTPWLWADLLKMLFGRARPVLYLQNGFYGFQPLDMNPSFWSFPSGHSTVAAAVAVALSILMPSYRGTFVLLAFLVAISRVILGIHYPSDAVAGMLLGLEIAILLRAIFVHAGIPLWAGQHPPSPR